MIVLPPPNAKPNLTALVYTTCSVDLQIAILPQETSKGCCPRASSWPLGPFASASPFDRAALGFSFERIANVAYHHGGRNDVRVGLAWPRD